MADIGIRHKIPLFLSIPNLEILLPSYIKIAETRAPRVGWTSTSSGTLLGFSTDTIYDDQYDDWMANVFISADTDAMNWYQIDMGREEVGIYKVEIIKRLDRPLRFGVSLISIFH